jgi:hypothetical protein
MSEYGSDSMVDNGAIADDYFSAYEEVDGEGNPVVTEQQEPQGGQNPDQGKQADASRAAPAKTAQNDNANGFDSLFFKTDEKNQQVFDANAAHGFLFSENLPNFSYQRQQAAPQQAQQQQTQTQAQQAPPEDVPEWKKPFVERQKYEQEQANQLLYGINKMREQLGSQIDPQTAQFLNYQEQYVKQYIREELLPKWEFDQKIEQEKAANESREREFKYREYEAKANTNRAQIAEKMPGGDKGFEQFFFGSVMNGKHVPGYATDAVMHQFDIMNQDKAALQGDDFKKAFADWWYQYTANPKNLEFLYHAGIANFQRKNWDKMVGQVGKVKEAEIRQQQRGAMPLPQMTNQIQNMGGQSGTGHPELDRFMNGPETI